LNPLGRPGLAELERLREALAAAGRDPAALELVGGVRGSFPSASGVADLDRALAAAGPQRELGFTIFCVKPSKFTDDPGEVGALCRAVVERHW
jgi:hypothetical protein